MDSADQPAPRPEPDNTPHWATVHERLLSLGKERAAHERDVCRWLLAAQRLAVHVRAGYASLREYGDRVLGYSPRQTEERLRVGRALAKLPLLDAALASGELSWSAVRELTRVATVQTENAWLAWAKPRRVHEIEGGVATRKPGETPHDRPDPSQLKHRLVFEVRAETMALFRDLQATARADLGADVDDDTLLFEIARRALGGPSDEGRASYQIAVTRCDACGTTTIDAGGSTHAVDEVIGDMAACDAQELGSGYRAPERHGAPASRRRSAGVPPAPGSVGGDESERPHTGASRRATQTIPPATRRAVMRRDHGHCVFPGCNHHRFLDVHHLDPRAEGGGHDPERLAVLCGAHHRAVHAGALRIDGTASGGFVFHHADGTAYGERVNLPAADIVRQVIGMLEHLGFKATQARALVDKALRVVEPTDAGVLLRAALRGS